MVVTWDQLALLAFLAWLPGGWRLEVTGRIPPRWWGYGVIGFGVLAAILSAA